MTIVDSVNSNFTFSPGNPKTGQAIQFTDASTNISQNGNCQFTWDWGDGSAKSTSKDASHTFYKVGNYMVMHTAMGGVNYTVTTSYHYVTVVSDYVPPAYCNPAGGNKANIGNKADPYLKNWTDVPYPGSQCIYPNLCLCDYEGGHYAKYSCQPNGSATLISDNHPDCCVYCGVNTAPPDAPPTVPPVPNFTVVDVVITPPTAYVGEYISVVAHISNSGVAAGTASVMFYWDDGTPLDVPRVTGVINVNTTVATPPAAGYVPKTAGTYKLCAVVS
jgi:PKD repeat protein